MNAFEVMLYGHAANDNLHVRLKKPQSISDDELKKLIKVLFHKIKDLGGAISGEHGIGALQKDLVSLFFDAEGIKLQKQLKSLFDPQGILNFGKVFDI